MEEFVGLQDLEANYQALQVYYHELHNWLFAEVLVLSTLSHPDG